MKKIFVLLGAPGSGKSTWIKKHHLEPYTVSADDCRLKLGGQIATVNPKTNELEWHNNSNNEKDVWKILNQQIESLMYNGQTIFVDNTHLYKGAFTIYDKLRKKYNYKVYLINFMAPLFETRSANEVIQLLSERNKHRKYQVPDEVIQRHVNRYISLNDLRTKNNHNVFKWATEIDANDEVRLNKALGMEITPNMEKYTRIQVIGDIHADYSALMKVFDSHKPGTAYVFVGDYLDRGTKTLETFKFITQEIGGSNLYFCTGNHEDGWEKWVQKRERHGQFAFLSLPKLLEEYGEKKLDQIIKKFNSNTHDYFVFDYYGKRYYVSHAGFEPIFLNKNVKMSLLPRDATIYGLSATGVKDAYARDIDKAWNNEAGLKDINLHGHRNNFDRFCEGNSYNLTVNGKFRWLTITPDGIEPHEINRIDVPDITTQLQNEDHIEQIKLEDGITANNFDRDAFINDIWNRMTIHARGLFTREDQVVGRGFNKFFQVGQLPAATLDSLEYPVTIEKKHDGFLAIVWYDSIKHKVKVYSKRGSTDYAKLAKLVLDKTGMMSKVQHYYSDATLRDTSLLFEIVIPSRDVHIVKYRHKHAFPLAIIKNNMNGNVLNLGDAPIQYSSRSNFQEMRELINYTNIFAVAHDRKELDKYIQKYSDDYPTREGMVLYGANKMLKIKLPFFLKAKELRSAIGHNGKKQWPYGAKHWFELCKDNNVTEFTPDLPLLLLQYEYSSELPEKLYKYMENLK